MCPRKLSSSRRPSASPDSCNRHQPRSRSGGVIYSASPIFTSVPSARNSLSFFYASVRKYPPASAIFVFSVISSIFGYTKTKRGKSHNIRFCAPYSNCTRMAYGYG